MKRRNLAFMMGFSGVVLTVAGTLAAAPGVYPTELGPSAIPLADVVLPQATESPFRLEGGISVVQPVADKPVAVVRDHPKDRLLQPGKDADAPVRQPVKPGLIANGKAGSGDVDLETLDRGLVDQREFGVAHGQTFPNSEAPRMGRRRCLMQGQLDQSGWGQPDPADAGGRDRQGKAEIAVFRLLWFLRKQGLQSFPPAPR